MSKRTAIAISALAVGAMCVFIFYMSSRPADESGAMSMGVVYHIIHLLAPGFDTMDVAAQTALLDQVDHIIRKIAHFSEYAALGLLSANLFKRLADRDRASGGQFAACLPWVVAWAFATMYAMTDEFHQMFVPGRSCMFTDVLIDSSGALLGVLIFAACSALIRKR